MSNQVESVKTVSVIIATAGNSNRAESLKAAIRSIEQQETITARIVVVFNGPNVSADLFEDISRMPGVDVKVLSTANLPSALNFGRQCVETDYFCFLDDDDVYLPHALKIRCDALSQNMHIDVVTTNGQVKTAGATATLLPDELAVETAPMEELLRQNWLPSCGGLYRASTVGDKYFRTDTKYFEWTMTAFLLAFDRKIMYLNNSTFIINETSGSLSASIDYLEAYPRILKKMLEFPVKRTIKTAIRARQSNALHAVSVAHHERGNNRKAWWFHLRSLMCPGGVRFFAYSRRLFFRLPVGD